MLSDELAEILQQAISAAEAIGDKETADFNREQLRKLRELDDEGCVDGEA